MSDLCHPLVPLGLSPSVAQKTKHYLRLACACLKLEGSSGEMRECLQKPEWPRERSFFFHLERVAGGEVGGEFGQPMLDVAFTPLLIGCFSFLFLKYIL